tara:strand:+ start:1210 stop:3540 length:2331 start_codon:yes stop_codon:yes gene_type:complete
MPQMAASANDKPFDFFIEEEVVVHPGETVAFRIAWHNIVSGERHFKIELNQSHSNLSIDDIPSEWTRVASGRLGEMNVNITVNPNSEYENIQFSLDITCQETPNWIETYDVDVLVSRWSNLKFGANDGSSFYVQQNVNTTSTVNISNNAGFEDMVKITMNTESDWQFGFVDDFNGDNEVHIDLQDGEDVFINFWIITPVVKDGVPLAGTGPSFSLQAESSLDRRVSCWNFSLEMQTFHNLTIDDAGENLVLDPGDDGRVEVTIRNNGNIDTYLDASLKLGSINDDRIEADGWTVALFNAFEFQVLTPNESRVIEIGFDAPNVNDNEIEIELLVRPLAFQQRVSNIMVSSEINWNRSGVLSVDDLSCSSVEWNKTCQKMIQIQNTGNFYEEYKLHLVDDTGMSFEINTNNIGLAKGEISEDIPLNMTPFVDAEGFLAAAVKLELHRNDGVVIDSETITSTTAPYVNWSWEDAQKSVSNGRLEIAVTMRNNGNIADGLIVRMSSSYFTEMSFIPPENSIFEDGGSKVRSFEIVNIAKGDDCTFRAWADLPDDQQSDDVFYLNITANSRLAEDQPFTYSANSSFEAVDSVKKESGVIASLGSVVSNIGELIWIWKWIIMAFCVSGFMINKSLKDRSKRMEEAALLVPQIQRDDTSENWMEEFAQKKQPVPEVAQSPNIPSEVFTGMFESVSGPKKQSLDPVDSQLVGAANTVLDYHDNAATKTRLDNLADQIAAGDFSKPHIANVALPDDVKPDTERTNPIKKTDTNNQKMFNLDDLDL